jgi:hypothetical protein
MAKAANDVTSASLGRRLSFASAAEVDTGLVLFLSVS